MSHLNEFLTTDQVTAVETLRTSLGVDPAGDPKFWEHLLAQMLSGEVTPTSAPHDLDLVDVPIEVKFSREFQMTLGNGRRSNVFRWTGLSGHGQTPKDATSTILVGLDRSRDVWFWIIPAIAIGDTNTVTCVVPSDRQGLDRALLDTYRHDASDLLAAALHYDRDHHAQTAQRTRTAVIEAEMEPLFGDDDHAH